MNNKGLIILVLAILQPARVLAAILYQAPIDATQFVLGSNIGEGEQQAADRFSLNRDAMLAGIEWYGGVYSSDPQAETDGGYRTFTIRLYADFEGLPANVPLFEQSVVTSIVGTGVSGMHMNHNDMPIFRYSADIDEFELESEVTYWLSVLNEDPVQIGEQWVWQASEYDPDLYVALRNYDADSWRVLADQQRNNMSFSLIGTTAVPVPSAVWLFGSGLLGLIGMARQKYPAY